MISVVIPAHNEEQLLPKCLENLAEQTTKKEFEIIVVDNNSTDNTASVAESFSDRLNIRVIPELTKGRGFARATGFANAKGDIIFSTDADTLVPTNWIERLSNEFNNPKVAAVAGKVRVHDLSWFHNQFYRLWQRTGELGYRIAFGHWWLGGYSFAIRKSVYEKVGGFNKELNAMEDIDLSMKVKKHGKIKQIRNTVFFSGRRYKKGFLKGGVGYITSFYHFLRTGGKSAYMGDVR